MDKPQYKLVPVEPTEIMVVSGFESVPDAGFSKPEVWDTYEEMTGCQQAAYRAKLCWAAMLASAPSPAISGMEGVDERHDLRSEILAAVNDLARRAPDDGEGWDEWFEAAFDLLRQKIYDAFAAPSLGIDAPEQPVAEVVGRHSVQVSQSVSRLTRLSAFPALDSVPDGSLLYAAPQQGKDAWLPIASAPRDAGARMIGLLRSGRVCTITTHRSVIIGPEKVGGGRETIGSKFDGYSEDRGDALIPRNFTHWMPLPPAPATPKGA